MMKINLWGQRNIFGGGIHFSSFSDALSDFSGFGSLLVEYDPSGLICVLTLIKHAAMINIFF